MKEILKGKVMIIMVLFIVGVCYLNCLDNAKMEETKENNQIILNEN